MNIELAQITSPFIALKTEMKTESFLTICEVTLRSGEAIDLVVKNGNYPAKLWVEDGVILVTPKAEKGDPRYEGMEPWKFCLEWQGEMPKGVTTLGDMQAHAAKEIDAGRGCSALAMELAEDLIA
jgi:hypothetical protein